MPPKPPHIHCLLVVALPDSACNTDSHSEVYLPEIANFCHIGNFYHLYKLWRCWLEIFFTAKLAAGAAALSSWVYAAFVAALAYFSRISASNFKVFDFTFGFLCFLHAGPSWPSPPGHPSLAIVVLLLMWKQCCHCFFDGGFLGRVVLKGRQTCCFPNILHMHKVLFLWQCKPCEMPTAGSQLMAYLMDVECLLWTWRRVVQATWKHTECCLYFHLDEFFWRGVSNKQVCPKE